MVHFYRFSAINIRCKGYRSIFLQTYMIMGLVGWEMAKGTIFPNKNFFIPQTPFLVQILVNLGRILLAGNQKDVSRSSG